MNKNKMFKNKIVSIVRKYMLLIYFNEFIFNLINESKNIYLTV